MNRLFFPEKDLKAIIYRMEKILKNLAKNQDFPVNKAIPFFNYKERPWLDSSIGELIVIDGGLRSSIGDFFYLDLKVKVVKKELCFWVKSEGAIDEQRFCEETSPGDISDKSLIGLLENWYGFGQASE
jgi:hypothetical protein